MSLHHVRRKRRGIGIPDWMSMADYSQRAEDHQCLLVMAHRVGGQLTKLAFEQLYERISDIHQVHIASQQRIIRMRYKHLYPLENNEWGDFQAHRKVLGLICFGQCSDETELADLYATYSDVKKQYGSTIFDSRLIIFGLKEDGSAISPDEAEDEGIEIKDIEERISNFSEKKVLKDETNSPNNKRSNETNQTRKGSGDPAKRSSLQRVTNIAKLDPLSENLYEKDDAPDGNVLSINEAQIQESQDSNKTGGNQKNGGQKENPTHVIFYPSVEKSSDMEEKLREFCASLFWVLESKRLDRSQERQEKLPLLMTPFERRDYVGLDTDSRMYKKRCHGRLRKHLADLCLLAGLPGEALSHYHYALDVLRSANDWLWLGGAYEGLCSASVILMYNQQVHRPSFTRNLSFSVKRGVSAISQAKLQTSKAYPNGLDLADTRGRSCLLPDDIIDKYREAILQYSKFKAAGIVELEASIKACKVLIMQQKNLEASEFLQNVVYINVQTEEGKIERYNTLGILYAQLGMVRKAAFFRRLAAMQCVANKKPQWRQCYHLLLHSFDGYKLSLNPLDIPQGEPFGWSVVQQRVLRELIYSARHMDDPKITVRHLTLLLHTMFDHMSSDERRELTEVLESYTGRYEGTTETLIVEEDLVLPPVPLTKLPYVRRCRPQSLSPHLQPCKLRKKKDDHLNSSPFIYSPIQTSQSRDHTNPSKMSFQWVEGDACEVALQVYNPMSVDLKIADLGLITSGIDFECYPACRSLPPESGPLPIKILGMPNDTGMLTIKGYSTHVLGIRSECLLEHLDHIKGDHYDVEVVPALPQLSITTSLPAASSFSSMADNASIVTSATANIYAGQSCQCQVTLNNVGKQPIEYITMTVDSKIQQELLRKVLVWDESDLQSHLPLPPGASATFNIDVYGASDFLPLTVDGVFSPRSKNARWFPGEMVGDIGSEDGSEAVIIEALCKIQYSGGPGLIDDYCRQCSVSLTVEIQPSLVFNSWSVLLDQLSCQQCHVVFDVENLTCHDMEVEHSTKDRNDNFLIKAKECNRLSLPLQRIRFPDFTEIPLEPRSKYMTGCVAVRQDMYAQHIAQFIDIRWKMEEISAHGNVSVERLRWPDEMLTRIQVPPITWDATIDGSHWDDEAVSRNVGEQIDLSFAIRNELGCDIEEASLGVEWFRDEDTGVRLCDNTGHIVTIGNATKHCHKILNNSSEKHNIGMVFLAPGLYKLHITCTGAQPITELDKTQGQSTNQVSHTWRHRTLLLHVVDVE